MQIYDYIPILNRNHFNFYLEFNTRGEEDLHDVLKVCHVV